jgi:hypothetical protein
VRPHIAPFIVDASLGARRGRSPGEEPGGLSPPRLVLATPIAEDLPEVELRNGLAVVKHGLIADPQLFGNAGPGVGAVARAGWSSSAAMAVKVIRNDPYRRAGASQPGTPDALSWRRTSSETRGAVGTGW